VPAPFTVKARGRHGTESLDLTIPAELKREHGISEGDVFLVEIEEGEEPSITYKRIHEAEENE
jgi:bifunctional DNA-binding transcriptional regulator/antitoxin component of YhaV-PrlF toxin-antitoxin module